MNLKEYIESLRKNNREISHIDLDKNKEIAYMQQHKYRFDEIIKSIKTSRDIIRILDIGTTPFTLFLKKCNPNFEVSTLDLTKLMEKRCKSLGIQFKICDLANQDIPFSDNYFDLVIFSEVLEHLFIPPTIVISEIKRVIRPEGKLILSVPNFATLINRIKLLLGINPLSSPDNQMKRGWVHGYGHIREYTMNEITYILKSSNFIIKNKKFLCSSLKTFLGRAHVFGFIMLLRFVYYLIIFIIPSFKSTIYIECYKPQNKHTKRARRQLPKMRARARYGNSV